MIIVILASMIKFIAFNLMFAAATSYSFSSLLQRASEAKQPSAIKMRYTSVYKYLINVQLVKHITSFFNYRILQMKKIHEPYADYITQQSFLRY